MLLGDAFDDHLLGTKFLHVQRGEERAGDVFAQRNHHCVGIGNRQVLEQIAVGRVANDGLEDLASHHFQPIFLLVDPDHAAAIVSKPRCQGGTKAPHAEHDEDSRF